MNLIYKVSYSIFLRIFLLLLTMIDQSYIKNLLVFQTQLLLSLTYHLLQSFYFFNQFSITNGQTLHFLIGLVIRNRTLIE